MFTQWRASRNCFHHDHRTGESWIVSTLTHAGMGKTFWCRKCGRAWTV